jgi:hypothetical protein
MLADLPAIMPMRMEGPEANSAIMNVVTFVEKHLTEFSITYAGSSVKNENGLNQVLCILLNNYARIESCFFIFEKEFMEDVENGSSPKVDFGVIVLPINSKFYNSREPFFSIEAKRLGQTGKAREKEYLIGREEDGKYKPCGGVERFKMAIHGKNLQYSAMIGYVQAYDFNYWQKTIDGWIDDLIAGKISSSSHWSEKDKLQPLNQTANTAKFRSENSRKKGNIILFHLWVNLQVKIEGRAN